MEFPHKNKRSQWKDEQSVSNALIYFFVEAGLKTKMGIMRWDMAIRASLIVADYSTAIVDIDDR